MNRIKAECHKIDPQDVLVPHVIEYFDLAPVLLHKMKYIKIDCRHQFGSKEESVARYWDAQQLHVAYLLPDLDSLPKRLKLISAKEYQVE